jgi:hypothetical protein
VYYLTPDAIIDRNNIYIIQESKNTSQDLLPKLSDIQDGLFKLILFSNLDSLLLNQKTVSYIAQLNLTGKNIIDSIIFPDETEKIDLFLSVNKFKQEQIRIIKALALEAKNNNNLKIEISSNS